mmetsp:Transcript_27866/g.50404  ORF Transcript_27866/g.50404 Transcript_27866/m.50404 type:complete len:344 (+) Transcript_27866:87-1118(+)|eukprot:CAMPEP_0201884530 /NCGR_PEP_ID=MMETSP0902-20130614/17395_1 /ASSEMBLY_ACC=CAM_ASM_000551 /TAXON_ID=420261 /ORGANISM="Thalassiosira antarctica, Strain CCMP982" /LENGTH=343 /DNA_ID=CAMNT_0048413515 /DNA_START=61 /DNA_END=1092 /DNA_ORIENTATION=+
MNISIKLALALMPVITTALQFPSPISSNDQISRRSAVSKLITSSTAAVASGAASSILMPPGVANAVDSVSQVTLNSKNKKPFPLASFGLQVYDDDTAYRLTLTALEVGYRNFFASVLAGNQKGFAKAVKASGIPRDELYICGSVLSNRVNGEKAAYEKTKQGCLENMSAFAAGNIDHLDMIMLDYPGPNDESIRGQWQAFEEMHSKDKTVDDLAVSNFSPNQLDAILVNPDATKPTVNQLPFSLAYHPQGILDYNAKRDILVQSWSPLSRVLPRYGKTLDAIGQNYGKSAAQVGLRWIVQSGAAFSTQSKSKSHFEEDLKVFDFALSDEEMAKITQLAAAGVL